MAFAPEIATNWVLFDCRNADDDLITQFFICLPNLLMCLPIDFPPLRLISSVGDCNCRRNIWYLISTQLKANKKNADGLFDGKQAIPFEW